MNIWKPFCFFYIILNKTGETIVKIILITISEENNSGVKMPAFNPIVAITNSTPPFELSPIPIKNYFLKVH